MSTRVVTIAMTTGAQADQVGWLVAEHLGWKYVSDEIIDKAAEQARVSRGEVAEAEHSPSLISRIISAFGSAALREYGDLVPPGDDMEVSPSYRRLIQKVIREVAAKGNVVILAHGASILLARQPGVLRVLVTASVDLRASRVATASGQDLPQATREIQRTDGERRAFFKSFYDLDEELPTYYDLVVNTDVLTPAKAARIIAYAVDAA